MVPKERLENVLHGREVDSASCICPGGMMNTITKELMDMVKIHMPEVHYDAKKWLNWLWRYIIINALKIMEYHFV